MVTTLKQTPFLENIRQLSYSQRYKNMSLDGTKSHLFDEKKPQFSKQTKFHFLTPKVSLIYSVPSCRLVESAGGTSSKCL